MKYYGGCDSGSTYTKCVIIDETGKMVADVTLRSRINAVLSCEESIEKAVAQVPDLKSADDLAYLVGTGYDVTRYLPQTRISQKSPVMPWACM